MKSFSLITSFLLIIVLLVCPVCCGTGACYANGCCSIEQTNATILQEKGCGGCCSNARTDLSHQALAGQDSAGQVPTQPSDSEKSHCQGVCSGAILNVQLESVESILRPFHLLASIESVEISTQLSVPENLANKSFSDENYGRYLCALYSSFQC